MKNLIALILLITLPLLASSQTLSNYSTCCVPCKSLKKALLVKTERDYLKDQIGVARDSIVILSRIVSNQDSVIIKQDTTISLYKKNEDEYIQIVKNKDTEMVSLTCENWNKIYEKLYGGFEDLASSALEDEEEEDELANVPAHMKTKEGYLKDGFVVDNEYVSIESNSASDSELSEEEYQV